jgi:hypothetical protein
LAGFGSPVLDQHREFAETASVWDAAAEPYRDLFELEQSLHEQAGRIAELGDAAPQVLEAYGHDLEHFTHAGGTSCTPGLTRCSTASASILSALANSSPRP